MRAKYVLSEVATGLWRNVTMTIAMMITMAVSLSMLGASLLLFWQVNKLKDFYYAKVEVSIFLKADITEDQRKALRTELAAALLAPGVTSATCPAQAPATVCDPLVQSIEYETKQQAWERFKVQFKDAPDLVNATKADQLPESFRVKLHDPKQFAQIYDKYKTKPGVDDVIDQRELLAKLFNVLGALQRLALIVAVVQGLAALLLVANTIQVAAYSKRREVAVMKLVGASNWFIQLPFVLEAIFAGLIGSLIAFLVLVSAKVFLFDDSLKSLSNLLLPVDWKNIWQLLIYLPGIGGAVSAITGWFTLRFYVKV